MAWWSTGQYLFALGSNMSHSSESVLYPTMMPFHAVSANFPFRRSFGICTYAAQPNILVFCNLEVLPVADSRGVRPPIEVWGVRLYEANSYWGIYSLYLLKLSQSPRHWTVVHDLIWSLLFAIFSS